jgi:hypothetical protein
MPETTQTGKSKSNAGSGKMPGALEPKLGPKRFDPAEHGGVKKQGRLFLFFGVILPALAMIFESSLHFCARHFFDPFPSPAHTVLFALIPFSNFLVWLGTRRDLSNHYAFMSLVSGMAMGVGCLYTLMFLPLTPMACLFSLLLGFGLLGLAPLLSLPCSWISGKTVCHLAAKKITYFNAHQVEHIGHMIILVMVIAVELPSTLTRVHLSQAADPNAAVARDGVAWLRRFGSQEVLLRACYERSGRATDILGSLYESAHPLNVDEARRIFYQVTGKPFNSVPIPRSARATIQHTGAAPADNSPNAGVEDEFDLDTDIAGEAVSGVARGLSVQQSNLACKIDADAALASVDWTFAFVNDSKFDREARAKVLLPPHSVVTRATLTVNNVEKDASIMVRSIARAHYRRAVAEHKDPLLVSTCGPDQLLVQCFPVRPGESMKVKLQIAAPLEIDQKEKGVLALPAFMERNFQLEQPNSVDIQSTRQFTAGGMKTAGAESKNAAGLFQLKGSLDAAHMAGFDCIVAVERDKNCKVVWCKTDKIAGGAECRRVLSPARIDDVKNIIVVIDGSASMQQFMPQIAEGLKAMPQSINAQIKVVGDSVSDLLYVPALGGTPLYLSALDKVKSFQTAGGEDDSAALSTALTQASTQSKSAVLWIHAAQPVTRATSFPIKQFLDCAGGRPLLLDMQLVAGPNELLNGLNDNSCLLRVPREGTPAEDLATLLQACNIASPTGQTSGFKRRSVSLGTFLPEYILPTPVEAEAVPGNPSSNNVPLSVVRPGEQYQILDWDENSPQRGYETDTRLAEIWANQEICLDLQSQDPIRADEPALLAEAFQIVSPVSSAVVTTPAPVKKSPRHLVLCVTPTSRHMVVDQDSPMANLKRDTDEAKKETGNKPASPQASGGPVVAGRLDATGYMQKFPMSGSNRTAVAPSAPGPQSSSATSRFNYFAKYPVQFEGNKAEQAAPQLQGATNGTIGLMNSLSSLSKAKSADSSPAASHDLLGRPVDFMKAPSREADQFTDDQAAVPEAKIVPEADTWLLLMVIGAVLAWAWFAKLRKVKS